MLLLKTVGPKIVLGTALKGARDVDQTHIYGSWTARCVGEPGSEQRDIDLLIIGMPVVGDIRRRADSASEQLGRDVNVAVLTAAKWSNAPSGLVDHVRASPLMALERTDDDMGPVPRVTA